MANPPPAEMTPALRALDRVFEITFLLEADMTSSLAELGLTPSRVRLLWAVHHRGPSTQRDLAAELGVSARNVTGLVDALEESGFVVRRPHPADRRALLVEPSEHGARTVERLIAGRVELAEILFGEVSAAELTRFVRGLDRLSERLQELVGEVGS